MSSNTRLYGLSTQDIASIQAVLRNHSKITHAILYGSRAMGNFRANSDIDLTLKGNSLTLTDLTQVCVDLDELLLPYTIDLSLYNGIDNAELIAHIERVGQDFYTRA